MRVLHVENIVPGGSEVRKEKNNQSFFLLLDDITSVQKWWADNYDLGPSRLGSNIPSILVTFKTAEKRNYHIWTGRDELYDYLIKLISSLDMYLENTIFEFKPEAKND